MKKGILIIVAFILCPVAPVHYAFAYGGGGESGGKITITPASDKTRSYEVDEAALQNGDTIVAGKHGATITWPNGGKIVIKPNTKIQIHPEGFRVHMGKTWIKLNYNEKTKKFRALTPNASTGRRS
jgi:hypothetical protein